MKRRPQPRVVVKCSHPGCDTLVETSVNMASRSKCDAHKVQNMRIKCAPGTTA